MIYLLCCDYQNTSNNHAGIKYLCKSLAQIDENIKCITIPFFISGLTASRSKIIRFFQYNLARFKQSFYVKRHVNGLLRVLHEEDSLFVMEYLDGGPLTRITSSIRTKFPNLKIFAMVHLVPSKLDYIYKRNEDLFNYTEIVDKIVTLGHSLTDYLLSRGVPSNKIYTAFHYVDSYYYNENIKKVDSRIKVIAMGNQVRNIDLLLDVVKANPTLSFRICQGTQDLSHLFKGIENVELIPFVEENILRHYMEEADISLNVMQDTIGSNVIVTSLAMGLAMICSDVGSIRDYCDSSNSILCPNSIVSFNEALEELAKSPQKLMSMKYASAAKAKELTITRTYRWMLSLLSA